jgi:hypothetical protein
MKNKEKYQDVEKLNIDELEKTKVLELKKLNNNVKNILEIIKMVIYLNLIGCAVILFHYWYYFR